MSWRDPSFVYRSAATHADPSCFRRRMQERRREAQKRSALIREEQAAKVKPIANRKSQG